MICLPAPRMPFWRIRKNKKDIEDLKNELNQDEHLISLEELFERLDVDPQVVS